MEPTEPTARTAEAPDVASLHEVVQLLPTHDFGPLLMIVDVVKAWGVRCYTWVPTKRGEHSLAYLRIAHTEYKRLGCKAELIVPIGSDAAAPRPPEE